VQAFGASLATIGLMTMTAGCGESKPELIPVTGKVMLDGQPAKEGGVVFHGEGNLKMVGGIATDGTYKMMRNRDEGVPPGTYRVTVFVTETPADAAGNPVDLPKTLSNKKFMDANSTPLTVTVQDSAPEGAYDLAVTR
jgi:hypothetical protein